MVKRRSNTPLPSPGKLDEILRSGRAPGFIVKGSDSLRVSPKAVACDRDGMPLIGGQTVDQINRQEATAVRETKAIAECPKRRGSDVRLVGALPLSTYRQARKELGHGAFQGEETRETLKRLGGEF